MFSHVFWRLAVERAVKTFAQTLVALFSIGGVGLLNAPWTAAFSAAGMAAVLSVLTSMSSEPMGERRSPSLVRPTEPAEPAAEPRSSVAV